MKIIFRLSSTVPVSRSKVGVGDASLAMRVTEQSKETCLQMKSHCVGMKRESFLIISADGNATCVLAERRRVTTTTAPFLKSCQKNKEDAQ